MSGRTFAEALREFDLDLVIMVLALMVFFIFHWRIIP